MDKIIQLNTVELSLSISKVENRLASNVANVADNLNSDINAKFNKINVNLESNSV